jgi:hypothetical protein
MYISNAPMHVHPPLDRHTDWLWKSSLEASRSRSFEEAVQDHASAMPGFQDSELSTCHGAPEPKQRKKDRF